jgi:hypothetical protein
MARRSKALALHLLRTVYNVTDRPMQWRSLEGLDVPETAEFSALCDREGLDLGAGRAQRVPDESRPEIDDQ